MDVVAVIGHERKKLRSSQQHPAALIAAERAIDRALDPKKTAACTAPQLIV
jgi:hypothetical protein